MGSRGVGGVVGGCKIRDAWAWGYMQYRRIGCISKTARKEEVEGGGGGGVGLRGQEETERGERDRRDSRDAMQSATESGIKDNCKSTVGQARCRLLLYLYTECHVCGVSRWSGLGRLYWE